MNNPYHTERIQRKEERMLRILRTITKIMKLSNHKYFQDMQKLWAKDIHFSNLIPLLDDALLLPTMLK